MWFFYTTTAFGGISNSDQVMCIALPSAGTYNVNFSWVIGSLSH